MITAIQLTAYQEVSAASAFLYSIDKEGDLRQINPSTASSSFIGTVTLNGWQMAGLAYGSGNLYSIDLEGDLRQINPSTASSSFIGTVTLNGWQMAGLAYEQQWAITTSSSPSNGGSTSGGGTYDDGTGVSVTATANSCFSFANWTEGGMVVSTSTKYTFTASANESLVANFNQITYVITTSVSPSGGGTISGGGTVDCGTSATLVATANPCYTFTNWTEGGTVVGTSTNYTFTASANETLMANFVLNTYTISTSSSPQAGGIIAGGGTINCGSNVTVTATANPCYTFTNWTEGGTVVGTSPSYSFTASTNETVEANFVLNTYTINTSSSPPAGGITTGGRTVSCGSNLTVTATANPCYTFTNWTEGGTMVGTSPSYNFTASGNETLVANFVLNTYTINTSSSPTNAGITTGGGTANCGSSVTVTATTNVGYYFVNWTAAGNVLSSNSIYTFAASSNETLVANFNGNGYVAPFYYSVNDGAITITGYTGPGGAVTIPSTISDLAVTSIGTNAFYQCTNLTTVTISNSVTSIGEDAFAGCARLTNVTIGTNVTNIGDYAFAGCGLTSVTIPNSVISIGSFVFEFSFMTNITIGNSVTSIGVQAFWNCGLTSLTIPGSVTNIGLGAFGACYDLTAITVNPSNPAYISLNGVMFNESQTTLVQYPGGKFGSYSVPNSVTSIGEDAFAGCASLTSLTIPDSVTNIGIGAFAFCYSLSSITIPSSVTSIGLEAFALCDRLTSVYFEGNAPAVYGTVFGGDSATVYYLPGTTFWDPQIQTSNGTFGVQTNGFGFNISGSSSLSIIVEACTNLGNPIWSPVATNTGSSYFSDPQWTNYPARFYRLSGVTFDGVRTVLWNPLIQANGANFGVRSNQFGFNITGTTNFTVVVEACTNLASPVWTPLQTVTLTNGSFYFTDPQWTNYPSRFYGLGLP